MLMMDYLKQKGAILLLTGCMIFLASPGRAQSSVNISAPRLEVEGNILHIYYDILEGIPGEKYDIAVEIRDENGNIIEARSLEGDIGQLEEGGDNKHIRWNLEADQIFIDAFVFVKIDATVIPLPREELVAEQVDSIPEQIEDGEPYQQDLVVEEELSGLPESTARTFTRSGLILQSLAFPGLGLSRFTGKPHWIRGAAAYGCLAGSVILNRKAVNTYDSMQEMTEADDIAHTFEQSVNQDKVSELLVYAAAGIWVTDIVWNILGTSEMNKISFASNLDPITFVPMIRVSYRF